MNADVGSMCSRNPITVEAGASVAAAAQLMRQHHVGLLVVVKAQATSFTPVGVISDRDLVMDVMAEGLEPNDVVVGDVMTDTLVTVQETDTPFGAIGAMRRTGVRRVLVLDAHRELVGVLSIDDLLSVFAEEMGGLARALHVEARTERLRRPPSLVSAAVYPYP